MLPNHAPSPGVVSAKDWRRLLKKRVVKQLDKINATIMAAINTSKKPRTAGCDSDFHSLWIGALLLSGACTTFDAAHEWATFVRYDTDLETS